MDNTHTQKTGSTDLGAYIWAPLTALVFYAANTFELDPDSDGVAYLGYLPLAFVLGNLLAQLRFRRPQTPMRLGLFTAAWLCAGFAAWNAWQLVWEQSDWPKLTLGLTVLMTVGGYLMSKDSEISETLS